MSLVCFQTIVGYHGTLFGKALHMLCLFREEALGDKQGEVCVLYSGLLEHIVKYTLHLFPDCIAVRLDHHTAAYVRLFSQVGFNHQFVIPFAVVLTPFGEEFQFFCHYILSFMFVRILKFNPSYVLKPLQKY